MFASWLPHHVQIMKASSGLDSLKVLAIFRKVGGLPFLAATAKFAFSEKRVFILANHSAVPSGLAVSARGHSEWEGSTTSHTSLPDS